MRSRFFRLCLLTAIAVPAIGAAAVRLRAQTLPGDGCTCKSTCTGGPAICQTIICSDGRTFDCYRPKQTAP